jgi:hypothetical protein
MALVTLSASASKGGSVVVTLDKTTLFGLSPVSGDPYWSDDFNVDRVLVHYASAANKQRKILTFHVEDAQPEADVFFSLSADDEFQLDLITLIDYDGATFTLGRPALATAIPTISSLDISVGE